MKLLVSTLRANEKPSDKKNGTKRKQEHNKCATLAVLLGSDHIVVYHHGHNVRLGNHSIMHLLPWQHNRTVVINSYIANSLIKLENDFHFEVNL